MRAGWNETMAGHMGGLRIGIGLRRRGRGRGYWVAVGGRIGSGGDSDWDIVVGAAGSSCRLHTPFAIVFIA